MDIFCIECREIFELEPCHLSVDINANNRGRLVFVSTIDCPYCGAYENGWDALNDFLPADKVGDDEEQ